MKSKVWIIMAGLLALVYRWLGYVKPAVATVATDEWEAPAAPQPAVAVVVRNPQTKLRQTKLLLYFFIASEAFFFLALIISYVYYRNLSDVIARSDQLLNAPKTGLYTLALIASSGTLWWGHRAFRQDKPRVLRLSLLATLGLGAVFLYGQATEYAHLIEQQMTVSTNIFGSAFFTLTGFHALHVFIGLVVLLIVLLLSLAGNVQAPRSSAVTAAELYWHFVDVVWLVVFTIVYLIPLL